MQLIINQMELIINQMQLIIKAICNLRLDCQNWLYIESSLFCAKVGWRESRYAKRARRGRTHIVIMRDDSGACVVSKGAFYAEVGEKLTIKATVKEHDEYKGQAQTRVMRVKILEEITVWNWLLKLNSS